MEFATLFKTNCAGCHGADGEFGPAPPLNDSLFRSIVPEKELERVVSAGRPGTPMPAFALANGGTLTAAQIRVLVYEIKGISYKLADVAEGKETERQPVRDAAGIAPQWGFPKTVAANTPSYLSPTPTSIRTSADCERIRNTVFARACAGLSWRVRQRRSGRPHQRFFISRSYERPGAAAPDHHGATRLGETHGGPRLGDARLRGHKRPRLGL